MRGINKKCFVLDIEPQDFQVNEQRKRHSKRIDTKAKKV